MSELATSDYPRITARVRDDLTAEVSIDGRSRDITATEPEALREAVVSVLVQTASSLGYPVRATLFERSEQWPLLVHPDGRVEESAFSPAPEILTQTQEASLSFPSVPEAAVPAAPAPAVEHVPAAASAPATSAPSSPTPPASTPQHHTAQSAGGQLPTLTDLLQSRPDAPTGPAKLGWQGFIHRASGGVISPKPGTVERTRRATIENVQRIFDGPRTVVIVNPKGGAHKTTATVLLSATFGIHRGGSTLAWDNNETRGTLGWRAQQAHHHNTAVTLLNDLGKFQDIHSSRVGDLDHYVRTQVDSQFDVLASDEDAAASSTIDAAAFNRLHATLSHFYRMIVIDTGNNMRASNWEAAIEAADQLVIVSTVREDTAASAAWLLDGLREKGYGDKVAQAVTVLASPSKNVDEKLNQRLVQHFKALTRSVVSVPYDAALVDGATIHIDALSPHTREAWLTVAGAVAEGL